MNKKPEINKALVNRVKRLLVEVSAPMIPMCVLFEELGYTGLQGIYYAILAGVIEGLAIELGFEITKFGSQIVLKKDSKSDTNQQKVGSDNKKQEKE
jgi:hypothetical protein